MHPPQHWSRDNNPDTEDERLGLAIRETMAEDIDDALDRQGFKNIAVQLRR